MLFGVHRPKTGGTSIQHAFRQAYGEERILKLGEASTHFSNKKLLKLCLSNDLDELFEILASTMYVGGHSNNAKLLWFKRDIENIKSALVIRDPISLFWSAYHQRTYNKKGSRLTPERFLRKRSNAVAWHKEKYSRVFGENSLNPASKKFLYFSEYIVATSNISQSIPMIFKETAQWLHLPRRTTAADPRKIRHPLQDNDDFQSLLKKKLSKDYAFYTRASELIEDTTPRNKNFDPKKFKHKIKNFQNLDKPDNYLDELRNLILWKISMLERKASDDSTKNPLALKRQIKGWQTSLGGYNYSLKSFKEKFQRTRQ